MSNKTTLLLHQLEAEQAGFLKYGSWLVIILLATFVLWAALTDIDEFAIADGVVEPKEQVKVVQHLEGGVIDAILIREGDLVVAGQILLRLNLGVVNLNREEKQQELDALILKRDRLNAEVSDNMPEFTSIEAKRNKNFMATEQATFQARLQEKNLALEVIKKKIVQRNLEIQELQEKYRAVVNDLKIQTQQLAIQADLLKQGLISKIDFLTVKAKAVKARGEKAILLKGIPKAKAAKEQAEAEYTEIIGQFKRRATDELNDIALKIMKIKAILNVANEQKGRAVVRSPIDGIIKQLRFNTLGGVIRPGEAILDIVPKTDNLIVEAKLNPVDRGYVRMGQFTTVKLATFDFSRYGGLEGEVIRIGADSQTDKITGETYFEMDIRTTRNYLGIAEQQLVITPGMEATVEVKTGFRTVLEYLLKPMLRIKYEGFRER